MKLRAFLHRNRVALGAGGAALAALLYLRYRPSSAPANQPAAPVLLLPIQPRNNLSTGTVTSPAPAAPKTSSWGSPAASWIAGASRSGGWQLPPSTVPAGARQWLAMTPNRGLGG